MSNPRAMALTPIAILAAIVVMVTHEAIGHGGMCLTLGGEVTALSSTVSTCSQASKLLSPAGPGANLLLAATSLFAARLIDRRRVALRLFCATTFALSAFWECSYAIVSTLGGFGDYAVAVADFTGSSRFVSALLVGFGIAGSLLVARTVWQMLGGRTASGTVNQLWLAATATAVVAGFVTNAGDLRLTLQTAATIAAGYLWLLVMRPRAIAASRQKA